MELRAFFHGRFLNAVDAKGRVSLPADMRDVIAQRARRLAQTEGEYVSDKALYVAAHRDLPCLRGFDMGYLPTLFAQVEESVSHLTGAERVAAAEMEQASLFGDLEKTSFDDPGRMVLPPQSRRLAGIEGQALFIGAGQTFQIWSPQAFLDCAAVSDMDKARVRILMEAKA